MREKKARSCQESSKKLGLSSDYELRRSRWEPPKSSQRVPEKLLESRNGARRDPEELPRSSEDRRKRSQDHKPRCSRGHWKFNEHRGFFKLRRPIESLDLHRKGSWHQIMSFWRSLGHREATRRASRRSPRTPKSRSIEPAK